MTTPVRITSDAENQIREIDTWWRENRHAAPDLFVDELSESFDLIAGAPQIGRLYRRSPVERVRRLLLRATRYHVYYKLSKGEAIILAIWHARRGAGPPLRTR